MTKYILVIAIIGLVITGAGCSKQTETNSSSVTNTSADTNSTINANNTTGTFNTNTDVSPTTSATTATVTISGSGVSSKTLTVKSGTIVTFVNNHTRSHEIASNPHPAHTDLPGFDLTLAPGSSKSFTFSKVGSWGYHDHNDPFTAAWQGTIIVQ